MWDKRIDTGAAYCIACAGGTADRTAIASLGNVNGVYIGSGGAEGADVWNPRDAICTVGEQQGGGAVAAVGAIASKVDNIE